MSDKEIDLIELVKTVWANKKKLIVWGLIGAVIGIIISFSMPREYESKVLIATEGKSSSNNIGGMAGLIGVDLSGDSDGITESIYPEIVGSTPFIMEFVDIEVAKKKERMTLLTYLTKEQKSSWWSYVFGAPMKLLGWIMGSGSDEVLEESDSINFFNLSGEQRAYVGKMKNRVKIKNNNKTYSITVRMQDPLTAAIVADSVTSKLQLYMTRYRTSKSRITLVSEEKMLSEARQKYYEADALFAETADKNQNLSTKSALLKLERLSNEKNLTFSVYQQLASQVEMTRVKLQEEIPVATVIEPASVPLYATSPKKKIIVVAFTFLGMLTAACVVVFKSFKDEEAITDDITTS